MLCHCKKKHILQGVNVSFGTIRKKYVCSNGHKREVVRDRGLIEIIDNGEVISRVYIRDDAYKTKKLSGRRFK